MYYKKNHMDEMGGLKLEEPINIYYKSKQPIDLNFVKVLQFDKSFKDTDHFTDMDIYNIRCIPNDPSTKSIENVKHIDNFNSVFKKKI